VISATSFGSTQWTRDSTSGDPKRVERGGGALSGDALRASRSRRRCRSARTFTGSDSVRFWQWRPLIRMAIKGEIDQDALRGLLIHAFDDLEQERDLIVWPGGSPSSSISA
jgi:hypothetical protein